MGFDEILRRVTLAKNVKTSIERGELKVTDPRVTFCDVKESTYGKRYHFTYVEPYDDYVINITSDRRDAFLNPRVLDSNFNEVPTKCESEIVERYSHEYYNRSEGRCGYLGLDGIKYVYAGVRKGFALNNAYVGENFYGAVSMVKMKVVAVRKAKNEDSCYVLLSNEDGTVRCSSEDIEGIYLNKNDFLNNIPLRNANTLDVIGEIEELGFEPYNYDGVAYYTWDDINKKAIRHLVPWMRLNLIDIKIPDGTYKTEEECVKANKKVKKVRITKTTTLVKEFEESEADEVVDDPESCDYDLQDSGHDDWKAEIVSE